MQPALPWNPPGRQESCRIAPAMDYNTGQYHSDRQPNTRGGFRPDYSRQYHRHPNTRGSFRSNYSRHYHQQPNRRGGIPPNNSHRSFKRNNSKWKRRNANNMRRDPRVCTENERSNYLSPPPAPRNTTSFLLRARNNGGIAFDTPRDYTDIATPVNPNPTSHFAPGPDYPGDYIPTTPANNPNPSPHHRPELHHTSTSPVINGKPNPSPRLSDDNNHEASENLSPGSRRRRLEEENANLITQLNAMQMTINNIERRLMTLEHVHPSFSEDSIKYQQSDWQSS